MSVFSVAQHAEYRDSHPCRGGPDYLDKMPPYAKSPLQIPASRECAGTDMKVRAKTGSYSIPPLEDRASGYRR